jgi:hypothetical protein
MLRCLFWGNRQRTLPHLDCFVPETCLLIEDCQILYGREVAGVDLYRGF